MCVSTVVVMVAANLVIQSMQVESQRRRAAPQAAEWNLARRFVEAEVTSATRVITDVAAIEIPEECGIEATNSPMRLFSRWSGRCGCGMMHPSGKTFRSCLQPSMEFRTIDDGSMISGKALVRCGPRINHDNSYGGFYEAELCTDGQDSNCREVILDNLGSNDDCEDGFCVNATACESNGLDRQGLRFYLLANGLSTNSTNPYGQCLGTKSRVAPVYYFPDTRNVCAGEGNFNKRDLLYVSVDRSLDPVSYGSAGNRTLQLPQGAIGRSAGSDVRRQLL